MNKIILASASIGRKKLFHHYFPDFKVSVSNIDESRVQADDPGLLVKKLALLKARMVAKFYKDDLVFGFDTVVVCEKHILGKPVTKEEAREILIRIAGKEQSVLSGYAIVHQEKGIEISGIGETVLRMKPLTLEFINEYIEKHPVTRFAGGYGVQDNDELIDIIEGDMDTVIGAPMGLVLKHLEEIGFSVPAE